MTTEPTQTRAPRREDNAQVPPELRLELPTYSGPMDLLLDLIREHEIDIFDIPIATITGHYLAYVDQMEMLDLHIGGEWLELAATLVYIKSQMLLPPEPTADPEDTGPDPREELLKRIIEYQMFQWAAERLEERPQLKRDFFLPPPKAAQEHKEASTPKLRQASLFDLLDALKRVIEVKEEKPEWVYEITRDKLTLRGVILEIATALKQKPRMTFDELFQNVEFSRHRLVTTFLALLEMTRLNMIRLFQPRLSDDDRLLIERTVIDIVEVSQTLEFHDVD